VHVAYRHANQVYEDVQANVADLGLVAFPARGRSLDIIPLRKEPLVLICNPQHPLAKRKSTKLKALNGQKFISFDRDIPTRRAIDSIFKAHHVTVTHAMEFDNVETIKRAVEIDSGIAIVPQSTITQELADKTLAAVCLDEGNFVQPLAIVHSRAKVLTPAMKEFISLLKEPSA
jgi:DNA-binding transcriptional LysR family regulator